MTDSVANLILEHLHLLRNEVGTQGSKSDEQFQTVRLRLGSIEERLTLVGRATLNIHGDLGTVNARLDSLDTRVDRIERRLELREEA